MRRSLIISATAIAASLSLATLAASYATAGTVDVLTYGSQGGANVSVGDTLSSPLTANTSATFYTTTTGTTGGVCTASLTTGRVNTNPPVGGTATLTTTSQSFSHCTDNLSFSISSVTISTPYAGSMSASGVAVPSISGTVSGHDSFGRAVTCHYSGSNLTGGISFTNQKLTTTAGSSSECPSALYYSASYGPLTDPSVSGDPIVYLNVP